MQLHKLTGGKMIATNHRVNTLKIDDDRLVLTYIKLPRTILPFSCTGSHLAAPGLQSLTSPLFLFLNLHSPPLQRSTPHIILKWRSSWQSKILSHEAAMQGCYSFPLQPRKCIRKNSRPDRWVLSRNSTRFKYVVLCLLNYDVR